MNNLKNKYKILNEPKINSVKFQSEAFVLILKDDRRLTIPYKLFPEIGNLSPQDRKKVNLLAGFGLLFEKLDTVFHINDFLGFPKPYKEESYLNIAAEPTTKYHRSHIKTSVNRK